jgi:ABC-type sugar transport system substrate-binding protein
MKLRTALGIVTAATLTVAALAGCSATSAGGSAKPVIGISVKTITNDTFQEAWVHAAEAEIKKEGGTSVLLTAGGQTAVANQVSQVNDLVSRHVKALIVDPIDGQAIVPALKRAKAANIPVVIVDSAVATGNEALYQTYIATDNVAAAKQSAEFLVKALNDPSAQVAVIEGAAGSVPGDQRRDGFLAGLKEGGITPVASAAGDWASDKALTATENILTAHPKVTAILTAGGPMVDGIVQAVAGKPNIKVITIDGSKESIQYIIDGKVFALNTQDPVQMGKLGAQDAVGLAKGSIKPGSLNKYIDSGTKTISTDNAKAALANAF